MIERYQHTGVANIFSPDRRLAYWRDVSIALLEGRVNAGVAPREALDQALATPAPTWTDVRAMEAMTGHDVVAFLQAWIRMMPNQDFSRHIHYGLTSSDLVDNTHFHQLRLTAFLVHQRLAHLLTRLYTLTDAHRETPMLGRTHGQWAEPTTFGHRMAVFATMVTRASNRVVQVARMVGVSKTPGAVGTRSIYDGYLNPLIAEFGPQVDSTQVIPRDLQVEWGCAMVQAVTVCEAIALEIRLLARSDVREVREGANRVGSSAMPHKRNPIIAEKICGLARVARALLLPLLETVALHHDRDISNSSVERTAVPDLAHLTATIVENTCDLLSDLVVDPARMLENLENADYEPYSSLILAGLTSVIGMTYIQAHHLVEDAFKTEDALLHILNVMDDETARTFTNWLNDRMNAEWMTRHAE